MLIVPYGRFQRGGRQCSWTGIVPGHKSADRDEVAYGWSAFKEIGGDGM